MAPRLYRHVSAADVLLGRSPAATFATRWLRRRPRLGTREIVATPLRQAVHPRSKVQATVARDYVSRPEDALEQETLARPHRRQWPTTLLVSRFGLTIRIRPMKPRRCRGRGRSATQKRDGNSDDEDEQCLEDERVLGTRDVVLLQQVVGDRRLHFDARELPGEWCRDDFACTESGGANEDQRVGERGRRGPALQDVGGGHVTNDRGPPR